MDSRDARMFCLSLLARAIDRDGEAQQATVRELQILFPSIGEDLNKLLEQYREDLNKLLEGVRRLVDEPFADDVGGTDDPAWRLLVYLARGRDIDPAMHDRLKAAFGVPVQRPAS